MVLPVSTEDIIKSMALFKNKEDLDLEEASFNKSSDVIQSEETFEVSKNTVIRVSINTQRMPIFFLGSKWLKIPQLTSPYLIRHDATW